MMGRNSELHLPALLIPCAVSALSSAVLALAPQHPEQRRAFRSDVELVQVDVAVRDADGRPVRGLSAEDFTILDRGRAQPIAAFSEISHDWPDVSARPAPPTLKADVADNTTARSERVVILVIHDLGLWKDRVELVKALARKVVNELGPQASMALLFSSGRGGVELTEDRAALLEAIEKLQGQYYVARRGASYFRRTIQDVATYLRTEEARRKAVVVITEGGGGDVLGLFDLMRPRPHPEDPIRNPGYWRWSDIELLNMMEALRRSHATLYAVDPRGRLQTPDERARESRGSSAGLRMNDSLYLSQEALKLTAEASGGFAVIDTNELDAGLDRILADLDHYYLLGFHPPDPSDRTWHALNVHVNRPGVTVRHRVGYRLTEPPRPSRQVDPLVALSAGVLPKTALPLRLFATPVTQSDKEAKVAVVVELNAQGANLASDGPPRDRVRVMVLAADLRKKKVTKRASQDAMVVIPASRLSNGATAAYQIVVSLDLPPGRYQLRASADSERLGKSGSVYLGLDVPPLPKSGAMIIGLALGLAGSPRAVDGHETQGLLATSPVLDRIFSQADTLRVAYWLACRDCRGPVPSTVEIVSAAGDRIGGPMQRITAVPGERAEVRIPLTTLSPGSYRLRAAAGEGANVTTRDLGFAIRATKDLPPKLFK